MAASTRITERPRRGGFVDREHIDLGVTRHPFAKNLLSDEDEKKEPHEAYLNIPGAITSKTPNSEIFEPENTEPKRKNN